MIFRSGRKCCLIKNKMYSRQAFLSSGCRIHGKGNHQQGVVEPFIGKQLMWIVGIHQVPKIIFLWFDC